MLEYIFNILRYLFSAHLWSGANASSTVEGISSCGKETKFPMTLSWTLTKILFNQREGFPKKIKSI